MLYSPRRRARGAKTYKAANSVKPNAAIALNRAKAEGHATLGNKLLMPYTWNAGRKQICATHGSLLQKQQGSTAGTCCYCVWTWGLLGVSGMHTICTLHARPLSVHLENETCVGVKPHQECLLGYLLLLVGRHTAQGPHVVQPVCQLHNNDPDLLSHR